MADPPETAWPRAAVQVSGRPRLLEGTSLCTRAPHIGAIPPDCNFLSGTRKKKAGAFWRMATLEGEKSPFSG